MKLPEITRKFPSPKFHYLCQEGKKNQTRHRRPKNSLAIQPGFMRPLPCLYCSLRTGGGPPSVAWTPTYLPLLLDTSSQGQNSSVYWHCHCMLLCCDDLEWMLGKIAKYKPRAKKFNFDVQWKNGRPEQQGVKIDSYYDSSSTPAPGNWV
jgi:hypothetical protein